MPEVTSYATGTPCWVDVTSTDVDRSVEFYTGLFGWEAQRDPREDAGGYTMFLQRGKYVAAASPVWQEGMPAVWTTYIASDDVDATAAGARDAGGTVLVEPFDVLDAGRMSVVQDPTGAVFGVWQAGQHYGSQLADEPGSFTWSELQTRDVRAAERFYRAVFGLDVDLQEMAGTEYRVLKTAGKSVGGIAHLDAPAEDVPAHWSTVFEVVDCEAALDRTEELGGRKLMEPIEIPSIGRFAAAEDPLGAVFQVIKSTPPPAS